MPVDMTLLFYGAVFLCVLLVVETVLRLFFGGKRDEQINRRMRLRASGREADEIRAILRRSPRAEVGPDDDTPSSGPVAWFNRLLAESGSEAPTSRVLLRIVAVALILWVVMVVFVPGALLIGLPIAFMITFGGAVMMLMRRRSGRIRRFASQLPDALDMMVRSLRAGHPILTSMSLVAREFPDPIGSEMGLVVDETTYGLELSEALDNLRGRVNHADLHYMVVALNVQHRTGGNLSDVLANLASIIRDRARLHKKAHALSAEGRLAAIIIGILPIGIAIILTSVKADYYTGVMGDPIFTLLIIVGIIWYVVSMIAIFRIIRVNV